MGFMFTKNFMAWEFVAGKGNISDRIVTKYQRCSIFRDTLTLTTNLPGIKLLNSVFPKGDDERAFEWIMNCINRNMQVSDSYAFLICDKGKDETYTRIMRRMCVHNPISSCHGFWNETGKAQKNIPLDRIIEDPMFKDSEQSCFIQLADFCAYALLRQERPLASKSKYGLDKAFDVLEPILVREANRKDPRGIIRPNESSRNRRFKKTCTRLESRSKLVS